jgi:hypothetical protein
MIYLKKKYLFQAYRITRLDVARCFDRKCLWPEEDYWMRGDPYHPMNDERVGVKMQKTNGGHIYGPLCGKLRGKFK